MKLDDLTTRVGAWMKGTGPESDIVISSRIRLARNLDNFVFLTLASEPQKKELVQFISDALNTAKIMPSMYYFNLKELNELDREFLVERHLISKDHAEATGTRAVAFNQNETCSIMINEEDHLRIQGMRSGFHLSELWEEINELDNKLGKALPFAFSPQFGYLTACPTNVGTGLRVSVMLHLPALTIAKQIEKVFHALAKIKYTVRGFYGEGTQAAGDFYQLSNLISLGRSEKEIISEMQSVIPEIIKYERTWRTKLLEDQSKYLEDRIWRAYGILKYSHTIPSSEAMELLSAIRLGTNIELIKDMTIPQINELFIYTQPAHLQKIAKRSLNAAERDIFRGTFFREKLAKTT